MFTTNNLEVIRRACVKVNPEIVERKFGCLVEYMPKTHVGVYTGLGSDPAVVIFPWGVETIEDKFLKYTARPIRLADVLLAQNEKLPFIGAGRGYVGKMTDTVLIWNLQETLENQKPEVWSFLADLLK